MFKNKRKLFLPKTFLWRLTFLNFVVIAAAIVMSGWAIYHTACFLAEGTGQLSTAKQANFNAALFNYLLLFGGIAVILSMFVQYYFTKKLIKPINQLIDSTKILKTGTYPDPIETVAKDEIGELIRNYNALQEQLQANDQYRNKLIADISHELRTPIANLTGYMHALKTGVMEGDQKLFVSLYEQTTRLTNLVEQIEHLNEWVTPATEQAIVTGTVQMKQLLQKSIDLFSWQLRENGIELQTEIEEAEVNIHANGIEQAVANILDNAIRYYDGKGPIEIRGRRGTDMYSISVAGPANEIKAEEQKMLFDRFYRVDYSRTRETGGSGLGLAITKEIIDNHHGEISVQSENGINTFMIKLRI